MSNFIQDCLSGDALLSEIDNYIDMWHDSDSNESLHSFLGMTLKEYKLYIEDEAYLALIITSQKEKINLEEIVSSQLSIAARSDNSGKSERLQKWLKEEGLWD